MSLLSKLLGRLGIGPASSAGTKGVGARAAVPGSLSAPPEVTSETEEGFQDLLLFVQHSELLPLGSHVLRASGVHRGRRVALEVVFGPEWREGAIADRPSFQGMVTYRSVGPESDALLRVIDELYGTGAAPPAMAKLTDFACVTLSGDPRDLRSGPVHAKLFYEAETEDGYAELFTNVDLAARRLEIREKDPDYRAPIVRALKAASPR